jgi:hypothetical protein
MVEMSKSGAEVAKARSELLRELETIGAQPVAPQELIRQVAGNHDRDPYRAALMSLLASGVVERAAGWTVMLSPKRVGVRVG